MSSEHNIPTETLVERINEWAKDDSQEGEELQAMIARGASEHHPSLAFNLGKIAGRQERLDEIRAFLQTTTADQAGKLTPEALTAEPDEGIDK